MTKRDSPNKIISEKEGDDNRMWWKNDIIQKFISVFDTIWVQDQ